MFYRNIPDILKTITDSLDVDVNFKSWDSEINNIDSEESYPMFILAPMVNVMATANDELTDAYSISWVLVDKAEGDATESEILDVLNSIGEMSKTIFLTFENEWGYKTRRINGEQIDFNVTEPYTAQQVVMEAGDNRTGVAVSFTIENVDNDELCECPISIPDCAPATVIDSDEVTVVSVESGGVFACTPGVSISGIAYQRPNLTGQDVSFSLNDDGGQVQSGQRTYTPPANPIHIAALDDQATNPFLTLKVNNVFGNLFRFTGLTGGYQDVALSYFDKDGVGTTEALAFPSDIVVCNYSGLAYTRKIQDVNVANWDAALTSASASVVGGETDWFLPDMEISKNIDCWDASILSTAGASLSYPPFNLDFSDYSSIWTSTTKLNSSTTALFYGMGEFNDTGKTNATVETLFYRNHFN